VVRAHQKGQCSPRPRQLINIVILGVLVATKLDLKAIREVDENEGLQLAKKLGLDYFQVSTVSNLIITLGSQPRHRASIQLSSTEAALVEFKMTYISL
jgi:hypothetical protein